MHFTLIDKGLYDTYRPFFITTFLHFNQYDT